MTRSTAIDSTYVKAQRAGLLGPVIAEIGQRAGQDKAAEEELQNNARFHPTVPPQVEYALTDLRRSLAEPVAAMSG